MFSFSTLWAGDRKPKEKSKQSANTWECSGTQEGCLCGQLLFSPLHPSFHMER